MVDRITPTTTDADRELVAAALGYVDASPVATEPFHEWVITGRFPGRPAALGGRRRPLSSTTSPRSSSASSGCSTASHSLLAYAGSIRGHATIDEAIADPACRRWVEMLWDEAAAPPAARRRRRGVPGRPADRFANPRIRHRLAQIAADGSTKFLVRTVPAIRAERAAGRVPIGCATAVAAWILHLRGLGAPIKDAGAGAARDAANSGELPAVVPAVLDTLEPGLGADQDFVDAVLRQADALTSR